MKFQKKIQNPPISLHPNAYLIPIMEAITIWVKKNGESSSMCVIFLVNISIVVSFIHGRLELVWFFDVWKCVGCFSLSPLRLVTFFLKTIIYNYYINPFKPYGIYYMSHLFKTLDLYYYIIFTSISHWIKNPPRRTRVHIYEYNYLNFSFFLLEKICFFKSISE